MANIKLPENYREVFPNEETFNKIYDECLENQPQASEKIKDAYKEMHCWFEEYLAAYSEYMFRYAYQCGYEAARKGGVAV